MLLLKIGTLIGALIFMFMFFFGNGGIDAGISAIILLLIAELK